jgi:hypothetical protein
MAMTQINMSRKYENPILFVGALHLYYAQDDANFTRVKSRLIQYAGEDLSCLENVQNMGITDYLKHNNMGYTILSSREDNSIIYDQERLDSEYLTLFEAQRTGNYDDYINSVLSENYGILDYSSANHSDVTVRPATKEAGYFANAVKHTLTPAKGLPNSSQEFDYENGKIIGALQYKNQTPAKGIPNSSQEFDYENGNITDRIFGPDGKAMKDIDFGHSHDGAPDPHCHEWNWSRDPPRQDPTKNWTVCEDP